MHRNCIRTMVDSDSMFFFSFVIQINLLGRYNWLSEFRLSQRRIILLLLFFFFLLFYLVFYKQVVYLLKYQIHLFHVTVQLLHQFWLYEHFVKLTRLFICLLVWKADFHFDTWKSLFKWLLSLAWTFTLIPTLSALWAEPEAHLLF